MPNLPINKSFDLNSEDFIDVVKAGLREVYGMHLEQFDMTIIAHQNPSCTGEMAHVSAKKEKQSDLGDVKFSICWKDTKISD